MTRIDRSPLAVMVMMADPDPAVVARGIRKTADQIAQEGRRIVDRPHVDPETFIGENGTPFFFGWVLHMEGPGRG